MVCWRGCIAHFVPNSLRRQRNFNLVSRDRPDHGAAKLPNIEAGIPRNSWSDPPDRFALLPAISIAYLNRNQPSRFCLARPPRQRRHLETKRGAPCEDAPVRTGRTDQVFIDSKNSALFLVLRSLSSRKSIASMVPIGLRIRRSTYILFSTCGSVISSSLRVPEREMSIAGKVRLSDTLRSRISSELPVPLNSSKMTSSMRLPVSTSAVAMMVSEPPSSILRAAPKNRFGRCSALASTPPVSTLPAEGTVVL